MTEWDWVILGLYLLTTVGIGLYFTKKAVRSTADFFVAGRSLSWFIAGTSIVATTFSSDTPLVVAGISRETGIYGHWFWLSLATGQIATVFFFARLWRRSEVMTDIEFVVARYDPCRATSALRVFKVFFDGVLINCIVMASVTLAMAKIIKAMLDLPDVTLLHFPLLGDVNSVAVLLVVLGGVALLYSILSGLYGVVYTDLLQFVLAMAGSIALAAWVYVDASDGAGLLKKLSAAPNFKSDFLNFFPDLSSFNLASFTFFVYVFVTWWARAPGNGYYVQRLLATRSERDSVLAFLWFNVCQYVIRPWPWIVVGLLSLHYLPHLNDPESSFPMMINLFMPAGLKGIMVASMLAAFMSTIDTHLNWGTSYIVNDFYVPFMSGNKNPRHYIRVSRISMILLTIIALVITTRLTSVLGAYKYLAVMFGSIGTVMIARWYWWRVSPYSEMAAITTSLVLANYLQIRLPSTAEADLFAVRVVITVSVVTIVWVVVTLLTSKKIPGKHAIAFYSKMRIAGVGWKKVRELAQIDPRAGEFTQNLVAWLCCVVFLFCLTLGIGKFIFHEWVTGFVYITGAITSGYVLKKLMGRMQFLGSRTPEA
ncbi:MAG TPA: sodium:solute symporter family protein [Sedimentisphaerales bacterium]|nr:sodium:solute symporter family protein [Sedimentisphaerales bacterium]